MRFYILWKHGLGKTPKLELWMVKFHPIKSGRHFQMIYAYGLMIYMIKFFLDD